MHPELTDEHEALRTVVREFVAAEIEPHAEAWDRDHTFPVDTVLKMGELGLFGIPFPEPYGGGGDLTGLCVAIEEIARADQSLAITLEAGVGLGASPIHKFGTPAQQERVAARPLRRPRPRRLRAHRAGRRQRCRRHADEGPARRAAAWVIDGEKSFITNSGTPITSIVTVTALTGAGEISTIVVPAGTPGFEVQPPYRKMGWHASDTHGLTFVECRVPEANLLGPRGRGFAQFLEILDEGRIAIAALAVGVIQRCVDDSVAYANERHTFGRPIGSNQGVAFRCADMQVALAAARRLVYHAAWLRDHGRPFKTEAATAKLFATEAAIDATRSATQVFGGYGFMDETAVSRHYRDAKILEIGEGTSEVQRMVIGRALGLRV